MKTGAWVWGCGAVASLLLAANTVAARSVPAPVAGQEDTSVEVTRGKNQVTYEPQVPVRVEFRNDFHDRFRLTHFQLLVDGEVISEMVAGKGGELRQSFVAHMGDLPAGMHAVAVRAVLVGRAKGLFSYMENYRVNVVGSRAFQPTVGQPAVLTVVLDKKGGWTTPIEQQIELRFDGALDPAAGTRGGAPQTAAARTDNLP